MTGHLLRFQTNTVSMCFSRGLWLPTFDWMCLQTGWCTPAQRKHLVFASWICSVEENFECCNQRKKIPWGKNPVGFIESYIATPNPPAFLSKPWPTTVNANQQMPFHFLTESQERTRQCTVLGPDLDFNLRLHNKKAAALQDCHLSLEMCRNVDTWKRNLLYNQHPL